MNEARFRAHRAIFGQIAAGLPHQPHRRRLPPFAEQGCEQGLLGGGGHVGPRDGARRDCPLPMTGVNRSVGGKPLWPARFVQSKRPGSATRLEIRAYSAAFFISG